jgi:hypothetical protein
MGNSIWKPMLKAYSRSLMGFIRFIRENYPFPTFEKDDVAPRIKVPRKRDQDPTQL